LSVSHSYVGNNGGHGILVQPSGSASATATFNHVETQYNGQFFYGIALDATSTSGTVNGTVEDSVSSNNGGGFLIQSNIPNSITNLTVVRSVATNNHAGVQGGGEAYLWISESTINNNVVGCNGLVNSYQDNVVLGNLSGDCLAGSEKKQ
jgi:hypothetical protein